MWKWIRNWSIKQRVWGLLLLTIILMVTSTIVTIMETHKNLLIKKQQQTQYLVESAYSIISSFGDKVELGEMSIIEAQNAAKLMVKNMRYNKSDYFWINDMQPRMIMHPIKPALDNQDVSKVEDPTGELLFMTMVKRVREEGQGFVEYQWPKSGSDVPIDKISFVKGYSPWGWMVGSGVYIDDINNAFRSEIIYQSVRMLIILGVFIFFGLLLANSITRPMNKMVNAMNNIASGNADLTQRLDERGTNEMSAVAVGFNVFIQHIQDVINQVSVGSHKIDVSSDELSQLAGSSSISIERQRSEIEQVVTAMNEMAATIKNVADNASNAAESANKANDNAISGTEVVNGTVASIEALAASVIEASEAVNQVHAESENIGSILEVIRGIADQTNLLALNAAIEAARAGEQGRGFAVVADEVRNLAKRTQESTQEIQNMIESLQGGTLRAVSLIDQGRQRAEESVTQAGLAGKALNSITEAISEISNMNIQIAAASEQQSIVANDMDQNLIEIRDQTEGTANEIKNASGSSESLSQLSSDLTILVNQFKVA